MERYQPEVFLFGATPLGSELASRTAAAVETGLSSHCTGLRLNNEGLLEQIVPAFGGNVMATVICPHRRPQMATIMPGVLRECPIRQDHKGRVIRIRADVDPVEHALKFAPRLLEEISSPQGEERVALEHADRIVAGGFGVGGPEGWRLLEQLAEVLKAEVGATRPPVDEGWTTPERMIGQSGKTVRPSLYIGVGISGYMQHMVGVQEAGIVVAVNSDPCAPIFEFADFGIVGDYTRVLSRLIAVLKDAIHNQKP